MAAAAQNWCVVGGGLLGLTIAHRLADAGQRVTVVEAAPELGGLASAWQLGDIVWDRHYHVTLLSDLRLRALLGELDLEQEMRWTITRTGFYADGRLHRLNNAIDYLRFPPLALIDKVRLAATIFYGSRIKDGRALESIPIETWLTRLSGKRTFEQIWRPLLRAKLGENYRRTSAAFIWAVIRRLYAARQSGLKTEMFGYVPGGYSRILERFAERLKARDVAIQLGCPVHRIERTAGGISVHSARGEARFDQAVVTLAAPIASRICPALSQDEHDRLNSIVYQGIVCASVVLKRPLGGFYLTYITDETIPFTAVIEMTALVDPAAFGGRNLVYLPKYVASDDPFFAVPDDEVEQRFLVGLRRMYPDLERDDVLCFRVSRVRQVLAISTLNYSERLAPMITTVPGLAIVNSAHIVNGTLNVNETVSLAEAAIPRLLEAAVVRASSGDRQHEAAA
jgi:protoporphyrinogen oxidase